MKKEVNLSLVSLYVIENNGIRSVAAMLRKHGYKVIEIYFKDWINNRFVPPKEVELHNLIELLKKTKTDIVGISVRASAYHDVATIITERIRSSLKIPILWGGMHPTFVPEQCIGIADIVCIGEAEYVMLDLMDRLSEGKGIEDIQNLWIRRKEGVIIKNDLRPLTQDLDELPFRDFHSRDKYFIENNKVIPGDPYVTDPVYLMMCTRGCPFATCSYCDAPILKRIYANKGRFYRWRSPGSVIQEILYAKKCFKRLKRIRFDDEVFVSNRKWVEKFCEEYKEKIGLPFDCLLHPKVTDEEWLLKLKDAGLETVYLGIQNIERINRELYDRPVSDEEVLKAAGIIHRVKLTVSYQIILDDPVSTTEDKRSLFELLMKIPRPFELYLFSMTIYPKSSLAQKLLERKLITEDNIEGKAHKVFKQWRVDLGYPRSREDIFWISLIVLISKNFIPKAFLYKLAKNRFSLNHPKPLALFAQVCNIAKMALVAFQMTLRGEMNLTLIRRWANPKSLITQ